MKRVILISLVAMVLCCQAVLSPVMAQSSEAADSADSGIFWLWQLLGRLHPLVVHFPIAFLVFAAFLEIITLGKFHSKLRPGINMLILAGTAGAVVAVIFGWLLAENEGISGELLDFHMWTGIATAILSILVVILLNKIRGRNRSMQIKLYRSFLFLTAIGVSVTGHFGASMIYGEDFLTSVLPGNENYQTNAGGNFDLVAYEAGADGLSAENELKLIGDVRMVLAHNCYKCHSGAKVEGELRLDTKEYVFQGGESGPVIVPGNPSKSELIRRISLPRGHKEVMPNKGKSLSANEIALINLWVEKGAPWPDGAAEQSVYRVASMAPRKPALPPAPVGLDNPVDVWVDAYFKNKKQNWGKTVDDRTFLRRIYLDVVGLVPTPGEAEAFYKDVRPEKREILVRELLDRKDDYAMHWLTFWNDLLRNDYTGTGYITNGRFNITDWLYRSLEQNKPYDQFVRELLDPTEASKGFIEGIKWRGTVNASQRTEMQAAQNVGQVILGLNLKCASCHDSFISDWKLEEAYAFANIFADSTLEVSRCEIPTGKLAGTKILWEELGEIDSAASRSQKLRQLADNLVQPANGRMYRTVVNRIWKQMMGRGMVEPVDEMDNEPWSQDLLDWLAVDFVEKGYDLKELIHLIGTSKIYQSASIGVKSPDLLLADDYVFEGMVRRRVTAEQFSDAVSQIISPLFENEEMRYNPNELLPGESAKTSFPRASLVANNVLLTALGRPNREIVSTGRDSQANLLQALELTNGERLNAILKNGAERWNEKYGQGDVIIREIYQQALNRQPNPEELNIAMAALGDSPGIEQIQDLFWAVMLLPEFQLIY